MFSLKTNTIILEEVLNGEREGGEKGMKETK